MSLVVAIAYFVILTVVAGLITRRKVKSALDFSEAGRSLNWLLVALCFTLIPLGSGHTVSLAEQAVGPLGASTLWWSLGAGGVFLPIMMLWLGPLARRMGVSTFPQVSRDLYGRGMGWLHACVTIGSMSGLCAAEMIGSGVCIYALSGGTLPLTWCVLISFIVVELYVIFGGALQMAWVSLVNAIVMIAGSFLALAMVIGYIGEHLAFGGATGLAAVYEFYQSQGGLAKLTQFNLGQPALWLGIILPVILLHLTAGGVSQPHNIPFFAARSEEDCRKGVFLAAAINIMSAVPWVGLALIGAAMPTVVAAAGQDLGKLVIPLVALEALPPTIVGLLMVALLCATLSTAAAIVIANASLLTTDILKGALAPKMSGKAQLLALRICTLVCGLVCLIPALRLPIIMPVFFWCFTFSMPIFVNYIMGMLVRLNTKAAWINIIVAYLVAFIWTFTPPANVPPPFDMTVYPVLVISVVCGVILPFILPGGSPPRMSQMKMQPEPGGMKVAP